MTLYFWNKYNADAHTSSYTYYTDGSWGAWGGWVTVSGGSTVSGYSSYSFNSSTGYTYSGFFSGNIITAPYTYYKGGTTSVTEYNHGDSDGSGNVSYQARSKSATQQTGTSTSYTQGTFIETTQEAYDAHTNNTRNSDGYWWVRGDLATTPTVTAPNGNESIDAVFDITWTIPTDAVGGGLQTHIQLSTDDGSTWKDIIALTTANATDYSYDFTNETSSSASLIRARFYDTAHSSYSPFDQSDGVFTIQHNVGPSSPTNLSPSGGQSVDISNTVRFSWLHNDPNSNDPQSQFDMQWRPQGTSTWNSVSQVTPNQYYDMGTGILQHGNIEWQVRTYDQSGLVSPWSALATFLAGSKPANPTIVSPTNSTSVGVANPTFQWSSSGQVDYQVQVLDSSNAIYWDTGDVISTNKAVTIGNDLANGSNYTLKVRIKNSDGLWSDYVSVTVTVSYTSPALPSLTLVQNPDNAYVTVNISNPTPSGTQPTVTTNEIYRRKYGEANWIKIGESTITLLDYECPNGDYEYSTIAVGGNGIKSSRSSIVLVTTTFTGWWIIDTNTNESFQFLYNLPDLDISREEARQEIQTFSTKPFIRYGNYNTQRGSLSGLQYSNTSTSTRDYVINLQDLIDKRTTLYLKNDIGDSWNVNLFNFKRNVGTKILTNDGKFVEQVSVEWVEV